MKDLARVQLILSVGAAFIGVFAALIGTFFGLGGWGLALALWFALVSNFGWRILMSGVVVLGARHNGDVAGVMTAFSNLLLGIHLAVEPPKFSSWWGLLTPMAYLLITITLQSLYEILLNVTHSATRRK